MPVVKYVEAINQTLYNLMEDDERIVIIGAACIDSPWYVGGTLEGLKEIFPKRIIDCPCSENAVTGMAVGMAVMGMRPIMVFPRMDFKLYAMDPIIDQAAKWSYMFGGRMNVPLVIWAIINAKGSQGAQHSQDLRWIFKQIQGLKWVDEEDPLTVGSALREAFRDKNPVLFFDDRERYEKTVEVPEAYTIDFPIHIGIASGCPAPCSETLEKRFYGEI